MENNLRSFWKKHFKLNWKFGLLLLLVICVPRFILVLNANQTGNYSLIGLVMFISALIPFVFLNKNGQKQIGITKPKKIITLIYILVIGVSFGILLHFLGMLLYGNTYENWYEYIGKSYNIPEDISMHSKNVMFTTMALTGMTFSPIGEELFFRGIVHKAFSESLGDNKASVIDSSAFALTHISHFGLVFIYNKWVFYTVPALIWVLAMFFTGILFFQMKKLSGSIWGAVFCHSGFNLGMIFCIFYLI